jgi:integrase
MARRRYQSPEPEKHGKYWTIVIRKDEFVDGKITRVRKRVRIADLGIGIQEARKIAAEYVRPMNRGLEGLASATNFKYFIEKIYLPVAKPLMASTTYDRSDGVFRNCLLRAFGDLALRDLTTLTLQSYFSKMASGSLTQESRDKIRDVLSSAMNFAVENGLLVRNPAEPVRIPPDRRGRRRDKPWITPEQFAQLLEHIPEPYATMVYVAVFTGLRVSELVGLRWNNIKFDPPQLTVDERYCRGDWDAPKSEASNATIPVNLSVIERIFHLKSLTVNVCGGGPGAKAMRRYRVVKKDGPDDLVFQSVRTGAPMRDNNILSRFIKPAARMIGLPFVNWRCLRTSHATWLKMSGADVKDAQAQLRHSRASTTLDIYQQFVPESQRRAVDRLSQLAPIGTKTIDPETAKLLKEMVARDGVEPPTPAFSVCSFPALLTTCRSRTAA